MLTLRDAEINARTTQGAVGTTPPSCGIDANARTEGGKLQSLNTLALYNSNKNKQEEQVTYTTRHIEQHV